jgi:integrase
MKIVKGISSEELQRAMQERLDETDKRLGLLFALGLSTGYRISDLLRLQPLDVQNGVIDVVEAKTLKKRKMKLTEDILNRIREYQIQNKNEYYLFPTKNKSIQAPISRQWVHKKFKEIASELGISDIGTHTMRKTYAFNLLLYTRDFKAVQDSLNHRYLSTTLMYLLDSILEQLPPIGERVKPSTRL